MVYDFIFGWPEAAMFNLSKNNSCCTAAKFSEKNTGQKLFGGMMKRETN